MTVSNPRYPHTIRITRSETSTGVYDPFNPNPTGTTTTTVEIYYGYGRNYLRKDASPQNDVLNAKFAVSIAYVDIEVLAGDTIVVTEKNRTVSGIVRDAYLSNLGLTVYWDKVNN